MLHATLPPGSSLVLHAALPPGLSTVLRDAAQRTPERLNALHWGVRKN